jgi:hypothetical protein
MTTLIRNPRLREGLGNFILVFLSVGIVILYSSYQRPLWLDEFLQFGFAGFKQESLPEMTSRILESVKGINNGHTGFYFLVNYISLDALGASSVALRALSTLASIVVMIFAVLLIRFQRYSVTWQVLALLAVGASSFAMYYFGEAREYSVLAATVLFVVFYYSLPDNQKSRLVWKSLMWLAVVIGSANHFWFPVYLVGYAVLFALMPDSRHSSISVRGWRERLDFKFILASTVLSVVVALAGWWGGAAGLGRDPFEYTRPEGGFLIVWIDTHFQFLPIPGRSAPIALLLSFLLLTMLLMLFLIIRSPSLRAAGLSMFRPLSVIGLALGISLFLSFLSYLTQNWILNRYWMGSLLLAPIGTVWFLAALHTYLKPRVKWAAYGLAAASFLVIGAMAAYRLYGQVGALQSYAATAAEYREKYAGVTIADSQRLYDELGPVEAANVNIYLGGPVWPVFSCFYGCEEGYQDRLR